MRADGEEASIEAAVLHRLGDVGDAHTELERHAHRDDAHHLGVEHVARQAVLGNAETHHAAEQRAGFLDRDTVAEPAQVVRRRHSRRPGADDEHVLARPGARHVEAPAVLERLVAEEALDRVDADRGVDLAAVAHALA